MTIRRPAPLRGLFEDVFWRHLGDGRMCLQRCDLCSSWRYPAAPCCPRCGAEESTWMPVAGRGQIVSWTRFHRKYFPEMPPPYLVVSVALEEGPMVVGNLLGDQMATPAIGAPVRLRLQPVEAGTSQLNLPQWEPVAAANTEETEKR